MHLEPKKVHPPVAPLLLLPLLRPVALFIADTSQSGSSGLVRPFAARVIDPAEGDASTDPGVSDSGANGLPGAGNASPSGRSSPLPPASSGNVSCAATKVAKSGSTKGIQRRSKRG